MKNKNAYILLYHRLNSYTHNNQVPMSTELQMLADFEQGLSDSGDSDIEPDDDQVPISAERQRHADFSQGLSESEESEIAQNDETEPLSAGIQKPADFSQDLSKDNSFSVSKELPRDDREFNPFPSSCDFTQD